MAECAACGTRLEEGITQCPQCKANLARPGSFLQVCGWVTFCMSSIPLVVGAIAYLQGNYIPLGIGIAVLVAGVIMIAVARSRTAASPDPTRPSAAPVPPPSFGGPLAR